MKTYMIRVLQKDIKNGKPSSICGCPIALAVKRAVKTTEPIRVLLRSVMIGNRNIRMGNKAENFIARFDYGIAVKPFSFKLKL